MRATDAAASACLKFTCGKSRRLFFSLVPTLLVAIALCYTWWLVCCVQSGYLATYSYRLVSSSLSSPAVSSSQQGADTRKTFWWGWVIDCKNSLPPQAMWQYLAPFKIGNIWAMPTVEDCNFCVEQIYSYSSNCTTVDRNRFRNIWSPDF